MRTSIVACAAFLLVFHVVYPTPRQTFHQRIDRQESSSESVQDERQSDNAMFSVRYSDKN